MFSNLKPGCGSVNASRDSLLTSMKDLQFKDLAPKECLDKLVFRHHVPQDRAGRTYLHQMSLPT